jgi:hypothetical protein
MKRKTALGTSPAGASAVLRLAQARRGSSSPASASNPTLLRKLSARRDQKNGANENTQRAQFDEATNQPDQHGTSPAFSLSALIVHFLF